METDHCGNESLLYMEFTDRVDELARELLEIFCANVAITYESLLLREEIQDAQRSHARRAADGGAGRGQVDLREVSERGLSRCGARSKRPGASSEKALLLGREYARDDGSKATLQRGRSSALDH